MNAYSPIREIGWGCVIVWVRVDNVDFPFPRRRRRQTKSGNSRKPRKLLLRQKAKKPPGRDLSGVGSDAKFPAMLGI